MKPYSRGLAGGVIKRFVITFSSVGGAIWTAIQVYEFFLGTRPFAATGVGGIMLLAVGSAFVASLNVSIFLYRRLKGLHEKSGADENPDEQSSDEVEGALISELKSAYQDENWSEVIKIGSVLSRPLWVTGKYNLRVKIGKLVESAAAFSGDTKSQASALIDDLGWTNHVLGNSTDARRNILHGIRLAQESGEYYLAYKGYRHLSGMALKNENFEEATKYLERAREFARRIEDSGKREEVEAGLYVNEALIEMRRHNWAKALELLKTAQDIYRRAGDKDRETKLYHLIGDALFGMGELENAKDVYRKGLSVSKQASRKDGVLHNNLGIAKVAMVKDEYAEARQAYLEAAEVARELGLNEQAEEYRRKASVIER